MFLEVRMLQLRLLFLFCNLSHAVFHTMFHTTLRIVLLGLDTPRIQLIPQTAEFISTYYQER